MDSSPRSNKTPVPVTGVKRPAASLLPAFEPLSSSPALPRPLKRQTIAADENDTSARLKYPTPVPTSSTGIISSSPPHASHPQLARGLSTLSEHRAPLAAVPTVELSENGETILMGRSSNSSNYQLSANRLISRVHVKARYIPPVSLLDHPRVEIVCSGWNGLKLHCQGRTWELLRGDSFTSETEGTDIMIDVQDARVMVRWPKRDALAALSDSSWDDSPKARRQDGHGPGSVNQSPLRRTTARIASPVSPSPAVLSSRLHGLSPGEAVQIYEDASADEQDVSGQGITVDPGASHLTEITNSFSSDLSDPEDKDPDEENDPIVHSFGPFGANLSNRLASITAGSPKFSSPKRIPVSQLDATPPGPRQVLATSAPPSPSSSATSTSPSYDVVAIKNHVVNQLAFSRLSSTPLSTVLSHLPTDEKQGLTIDRLRGMLNGTPCVGIIARQGKDAAGKPLESEYYYVPEEDTDEQRRQAVVEGLRKPSLRNCRKQHKQYYWKRPKTP